LVGVLLVAVLSAASMASPAFALWLQQRLGIVQSVGPPGAVLGQPVAVHVIDVGQGEAILLCADGEYALVDAGPPEAADVLVAYLHSAGVESLQYLFMTHPHADHIGGMEKVLEHFPVQNVVLPDFSLAPYPTTSLFTGVLEALTARQVPGQTAAVGAVYPLGGGEICVLHAGLPTQDNYNLLSPALLFSAGGLRFLDTGDGEKPNEDALLASGADVTAHFLAAGHHGSSTSNTPAFVQAVSPQMVAISCAAGNSYGHPHSGPLEALTGVTSLVLRTDKDGSVAVWPTADGKILYAVMALKVVSDR
jgi:beta-lactamase superfamily II metal-dependent hydrolase